MKLRSLDCFLVLFRLTICLQTLHVVQVTYPSKRLSVCHFFSATALLWSIFLCYRCWSLFGSCSINCFSSSVKVFCATMLFNVRLGLHAGVSMSGTCRAEMLMFMVWGALSHIALNVARPFVCSLAFGWAIYFCRSSCWKSWAFHIKNSDFLVEWLPEGPSTNLNGHLMHCAINFFWAMEYSHASNSAYMWHSRCS